MSHEKLTHLTRGDIELWHTPFKNHLFPCSHALITHQLLNDCRLKTDKTDSTVRVCVCVLSIHAPVFIDTIRFRFDFQMFAVWLWARELLKNVHRLDVRACKRTELKTVSRRWREKTREYNMWDYSRWIACVWYACFAALVQIQLPTSTTISN